ncbi:helix-turn-helix domain-containing protein [Ectobacillus antri]
MYPTEAQALVIRQTFGC